MTLTSLKNYIESVKNDKELIKAKTTLDTVASDLEKAQKKLEAIKDKDYYKDQALEIINLENEIKFLKSKKEEITQEYHQIAKSIVEDTSDIGNEYYSKVADALDAEGLKKMASSNIAKSQQIKKELASEIISAVNQLKELLPEEECYALNSVLTSGINQQIFYELKKLKYDLSNLLHFR